MNTVIDWLLASDHLPPLDGSGLTKAVDRLGFSLTPQLQSIYSRCNGARWQVSPGDWLKLLPIDQIERARTAIYGTDSDDYGSPWIYAFFDCGGADFMGIDTRAGNELGEYSVYNCWHESFADEAGPQFVSASIYEFFEKLRDNNSTVRFRV